MLPAGRAVDKTAEPGTTSRALAVHARTLELYRQLDLADFVLAHGHKVPAVCFWIKGDRRARVSFAEVGADLTPYSFLQIFPQDEHERLLIARLQEMGVWVERRTELLGYDDDGARIAARLRTSDGRDEHCEAAYIAGCDGAHSVVRQTMGIDYPGATYRQVFYVADVEASGPAIDGELHADLDEADFLAVFPLAGKGRARLIGTVRDQRADRADSLKFKDVSSRIIDNLKVRIEKVNWFSTYHVHHRVADHFRNGRAFLLGDSAHIHSPAGGQGMNTGIGDAINLAWKLKAVLAGGAPDKLLDSYEVERIAFARRLVKTTDRVFSLATAEGRLAEIIRMRIVPLYLLRPAPRSRCVLLLIDNYDSFTYNLVHFLGDLGARCVVHRNDQITVDEAMALKPAGIVLSPGPCTPNEAGICMDLVRAAAKAQLPLLGVCLGHQAIGQVFGGKVVRAPKPMHGKLSGVAHKGQSVFEDVPSPFQATRYHSLIVDRAGFPKDLEVTAETGEIVMGLRHRSLPIHGVQFHPESIASEHGHKILENFLKIAGEHPSQQNRKKAA